MWLLAALGCGGGEVTPLGVTLGGGQVVVGDVTTVSLTLEGVFGSVEVPLEDVGVVVPVEGATLGQSGGQVTVWLRNGSELRGRWRDPTLALGVWAGGVSVPVDVPVDDVQAIQLRGGEEWPALGTYRVRTTHGDDVLVDPEHTQVTLSSTLGTFSPFLSECASIGPVGDPKGDWRVVLRSGTVLVGPLQQSELTLHLPSGPDEVDVALADLVSIDQQVWTVDQSTSYAMDVPAALGQGSTGGQVEPRAAPRGNLQSSDGWFRNDRLEGAKR